MGVEEVDEVEGGGGGGSLRLGGRPRFLLTGGCSSDGFS